MKAGAVGVLLLLAGGLGQAQQPATLILPPRVVAGQPATLAVLDGEGRLLAGATVRLGSEAQVTTDASGRATFTVPADTRLLLARLPGGEAVASALVVEQPAEFAASGVHVDSLPQIISLHDRFAVGGSGFAGEADANRVFLGSQPAIVLASSPAALVLLANPQTPPGATQVVIESRERKSSPFPTTVVALSLEAAKESLRRGERGILTVRVRGTEQRLTLEARNLAPEIVKLSGGDLQRVTTRGGGDNAVALELEGRAGGAFAVSVRLVPPPAGLPDIETVRQRLLTAYRAAPPNWAPRVSTVLAMLQNNPQDVTRVRDALERLLADSPEGEFGRLLEAAWRALLRL